MATTSHLFSGNGSTTEFTYTFPTIKTTDVKVKVGSVLYTKDATGSTGYTLLTNPTRVKFNTAPASGTSNVNIYRKTDVETAWAVFASGSSLKAKDLNTNQDQFLYWAQEDDNTDIETTTEVAKTGIYNVTSYGAKGDGTNDDTSEIQTCLNEAAGNGRVYFPAGTYLISDTLLIPSNSYVYGDGPQNTIIKMSPATAREVTLMRTGTRSTTVSGSRTTDGVRNNITLRSFKLDGNCDTAHTNGVLRKNNRDVTKKTLDSEGNETDQYLVWGDNLSICNSNHVKVEDVHSVDAFKHCFDVTSPRYQRSPVGTYAVTYDPEPSSYVWLEKCYASGAGDDNFTTHYSHHIWINDCFSENTKGHYVNTNSNCYEIDDGSSFVYLSNSTAKKGARGLQIKGHNYAPAPFNITVDGLKVLNCVNGVDVKHSGWNGKDNRTNAIDEDGSTTAADEEGNTIEFTGASATARNVILNNIDVIAPLNGRRQINQYPRKAGLEPHEIHTYLAHSGLKITSYENVSVNNFLVSDGRDNENDLIEEIHVVHAGTYSSAPTITIGTAWAQDTVYAVGNKRYTASGNWYEVIAIAGDAKSAASGTGPSTTAASITDDQVTWKYKGKQATATAALGTVFEGRNATASKTGVLTVTVTDKGSGYDFNPAVNFTAGTGSDTAAATSHRGTRSGAYLGSPNNAPFIGQASPVVDNATGSTYQYASYARSASGTKYPTSTTLRTDNADGVIFTSFRNAPIWLFGGARNVNLKNITIDGFHASERGLSLTSSFGRGPVYPVKEATYARSGTTITVSSAAHGYAAGDYIRFDFDNYEWKTHTAYTSGDKIINDGKHYTSDTTGTSAGAGDGPSGTSANIVDGTTRWDYVAATATKGYYKIATAATDTFTITDSASGTIASSPCVIETANDNDRQVWGSITVDGFSSIDGPKLPVRWSSSATKSTYRGSLDNYNIWAPQSRAHTTAGVYITNRYCRLGEGSIEGYAHPADGGVLPNKVVTREIDGEGTTVVPRVSDIHLLDEGNLTNTKDWSVNEGLRQSWQVNWSTEYDKDTGRATPMEVGWLGFSKSNGTDTNHNFDFVISGTTKDIAANSAGKYKEKNELPGTTTGATYARASNTITVTKSNHGFVVGDKVHLTFAGAATDSVAGTEGYEIQTVADLNTFTVTDAASGTISGGTSVEAITDSIAFNQVGFDLELTHQESSNSGGKPVAFSYPPGDTVYVEFNKVGGAGTVPTNGVFKVLENPQENPADTGVAHIEVTNRGSGYSGTPTVVIGKAPWTTATAYALGDQVPGKTATDSEYHLYTCAKAHTSTGAVGPTHTLDSDGNKETKEVHYTIATTDVDTGNNTITITSHGLANGTLLEYRTPLQSDGTTYETGIGGLNTEANNAEANFKSNVYYVVEQTTNNFKLSATEGGSAIDLTTTGHASQTLSIQDHWWTYCGQAARATATVASNAVTKITVNNIGSGYNYAPTISFTGGGGSSAAATATLQGQNRVTLANSDLTSQTVNGFVTKIYYAKCDPYLVVQADGTVRPGKDDTYDLGSSTFQWKDGFFDGTLETDALTIGGVTLAETIADTVGAMVTSNTETGISVTYEDGDNTLDFVIGTLNQDTTGTAAIATTVTVADESSDTTCFPLFGTAATGNLAPKSGSNLTFNSSTGELGVDGTLKFASAGNGINFHAHGGSNVNLLDDYEEGTWTPAAAFGGGTTSIAYTTQSGVYTKIGRQVTLQFNLELSNKGSDSGDFTITGLPFAVDDLIASTSVEASGVAAYWNDIGTNVATLMYYATGSTLKMTYTTGAADNPTTAANTDFDNDTSLRGTITYFAAT
tara:strand:- start:1967 stop:7441 length:5475 start_codon:yes stop_codon:yes gene_type:complete